MVPAIGARSVSSIFIASITSSGAFFATLSPGATRMRVTRAGIGALYVLAGESGRSNLPQAVLIVLVAYTVWILVAVWRCAEQASPRWRMVARSLTVAWAVNTVMVAGFLQLELLAARLGA